jgi:hypothetical protein
MSLPDSTLAGSILPGGLSGELPDGSLDTTQVIDELLPSLHAGSRADLTFWTEGDLIQWLDEALKRLARVACVFVGRTASILTVAGQAAYSLPQRHISTLHVSHLDTAIRPAGTMELEAQNPAYQTAQGTPAYWYEDLQGNAVFCLAPVPDTSDEPLPMIYEGWPDALDAGKQQTMVAAPPPLKGYLAMCVLAAAYGREGEMEMPDVAAHCKERVAMYDQIFQSYYGAGL